MAIIFYLSSFENLPKSEYKSIYIWIGLYVIYMVSLEIIRKLSSKFYETQWFRAIRILVNLIMISLLTIIFPVERHLIIFAYTIPISAESFDYDENNYVKTGCLFLPSWGFMEEDM